MPNENPYDRLARVFDNAVANYTEEAQRKKLLAENEARRLALRDEALKDRDEERTYAEKQRAARRSEDVADRTEARGYAEEQRQKIRGENREDTLWTNEQSMIAALVQEGFLNPADRKDPAKVAMAWAQLTPEAKQRVQDRKQAIDDIVKMVGQFGTMGVPGAETPELLQGDSVFQVAGALRQKAAAAKQRTGAAIANQLAKIQGLESQRDALVQNFQSEITPEDTAAAKQIIERRYGPGSSRNPKYQMELESAAAQQAESRINNTVAQVKSIKGGIDSATRQMDVLDGLNRSQVYLPEALSIADPNSGKPTEAPNPDTGDPMAGFFNTPEARAKKAAAEAKAKAAAEEKARLYAADPFAAQAAEDAKFSAAQRAAAQFINLYPEASRTDQQIADSLKDRRIVDNPVISFGLAPTVFPRSRAMTNAEKSAAFQDAVTPRNAKLKEAQDLVPLFKDYIDKLPDDQKQQLLKMAALFANPQQ